MAYVATESRWVPPGACYVPYPLQHMDARSVEKDGKDFVHMSLVTDLMSDTHEIAMNKANQLDIVRNCNTIMHMPKPQFADNVQRISATE